MRKLDALVAERRMGWQYQQDAPKGHFCLSAGSNSGWWKHPDPKYTGWGCEACGEGPPSYSTDYAAAWQVIDKGREQGQGWRLFSLPDGQWGIRLMCGPLTNSVVWSARAETAPLAVCLVALRAAGISETEIQAALEEGK